MCTFSASAEFPLPGGSGDTDRRRDRPSGKESGKYSRFSARGLREARVGRAVRGPEAKLLYCRLRDEMAYQSMFGSKMLAVVITAVIGVPPALCQPQTVRPQAAPPSGVPASLNIVDIRGDGATGRVRERASQSPAVRVTDDKQAPVAGAVVVFTLPTEGATGVFGNGAKSLAVVTDSNGSAVAQGLRFNDIPGKVPVHINVSYKGLTARVDITELSEAPAGYKPPSHHGGSGKMIAIVAVLAAGGAAGAVLATRKSSSSTPTSTPTAPVGIGITAGTGAIAPPF